MSDVTANYLLDLGFLLREEWEASKHNLASATQEEKQYATGYNYAYSRVISLMLQQAEAFDLPASAIRLEGINRDKDLGC